MNDDKFVEKIAKKIEDTIEEKFTRHMGMLLEQHKQEIQIVGEGHSTLLRNINEVKEEMQEMKAIMEKRLDKHDMHFNQIEKKLDTTIKQNDIRFKKIEEKIGA